MKLENENAKLSLQNGTASLTFAGGKEVVFNRTTNPHVTWYTEGDPKPGVSNFWNYVGYLERERTVHRVTIKSAELLKDTGGLVLKDLHIIFLG